MRVLLTTEGSYPYFLGGVSSWCDRLVRGLDEHRFVVMPVVGPRRIRPVLPLPANVEALLPASILRPREGVMRPRSAQRGDFDAAFEEFLGFLDDDLDAFGDGLLRLARQGERFDLWPLFERTRNWDLVRLRLGRKLSYQPTLAEVALAIGWLKGAVAPLLFTPPKSDLIHAVSGGLGALPAWLAARIHDRPLLVTEHNVYLRERLLGFHEEDDSAGLKALRAALYKNLARLLYQDADGIFSVSEFNRQWQRRLGAPAKRSRVIPSGVDPRTLPAAPEGVHALPTVVWVGTIGPEKDLDTLIRAFRLVKRRIPQARLRLFGPVPEEARAYAERIGARIRRYGLDEVIRLEGPIHPIYNAYHAGDVVVLASASEGFPTTAIEAMMCAKPVVATRVGGVAEVVAGSGRLVPPRDPETLAWALSELLLHRDLARALGRRARQRALEHYTLDRNLAAYRESYELLGRRRRAAPTLPTFSQPLLALPGVGEPVDAPRRVPPATPEPDPGGARPTLTLPPAAGAPPAAPPAAPYETLSGDPSLLVIGAGGEAAGGRPRQPTSEEFYVTIPTGPDDPQRAATSPMITFDEDHLVIEGGAAPDAEPSRVPVGNRDPEASAIGEDLFVVEPFEAHDLSDSEWAFVAPLFDDEADEADAVDLRRVVDGVRFKLNTGCPWNRVPDRYPPAALLERRHARWRRDGTLERMTEALMMLALSEQGLAPSREETPEDAKKTQLPKVLRTLFGSSGDNDPSPDKQRWRT